MICKLVKNADIGHLLNYLYMERQKARTLDAEGVATTSVKDCANCFDGHVRACGRENIRRPYGQIILSWSPKDRDRLNDELMVKVAKDIMTRLGIIGAQYVTVGHNGTAHRHIHIAYSLIDYEGRLINISYDWRKAVNACKQINKEYGFHTGERRGKKRFEKLRGRDKTRQDIRLAVYDALEMSESWKDFAEKLEKFGLRIALRISESSHGRIKDIIFSSDKQSFNGSKLDGGLSFLEIDDFFGGELQLMEMDLKGLAEKAESSMLVSFEALAEIFWPATGVSMSGGGGGSNGQLTGWDGRPVGEKDKDRYRRSQHM